MIDPRCKFCDNYHVDYIDEYVGWVCKGSYTACEYFSGDLYQIEDELDGL